MTTASKFYTMAEVAGHNHAKDCWLIIDGKVYDVTKFLEEHPGGDEVLLSATGKDATDDFEDVGHSTSARAMMEQYIVGDVDLASFPSKPTYTPAKQATYNPDKSSEFLIKILQFCSAPFNSRVGRGSTLSNQKGNQLKDVNRFAHLLFHGYKKKYCNSSTNFYLQEKLGVSRSRWIYRLSWGYV